MTDGNADKRRAADGEDLPPSGAEARAQRRAVKAPLLWLLLGLMVVAVFVMLIARGSGLFHAKASGPPPVRAVAATALDPSRANRHPVAGETGHG